MSNGEASTASKLQVIDAAAKPVFKIDSTVQEESLHILHVDDDASLLSISKTILQSENKFEIDNVTSVDDAFSRLKTFCYDAIISDYEMPIKNGLEFLKELREQKNNIGFVIFTGRGREEVAVKALNLGADRYIDKNGSPETVYCELANAIIEIAERKKAKSLLVESEAKYRMLVEESLQGIMIARGLPPQIIFANSAMSKMLGYAVEEFTSFSPQEVMKLVYCEDREAFFNRFKDRLMGIQRESSHDFRAVRKDGLIVWMQASSSRIQYNGQPALQSVFLDINERKKAEDTIRNSEEKYRELANFLPEIVFETDLSGKVTFLSQNAFELSGFTPEDIVKKGMNMLQFVVPADRERAKENIGIRMAGGKTGSGEYMLHRKNGDTYLAIVKTAPIYSENKLIGLRGLVIDITERKKDEEKLKASEQKYQATFEASMDALMLLDEKGFFDCNKATLRLFGSKSVEEFTKLHPADLSPPTQPDGTPSMQAAEGHIQTAFQTGADHFFWIHSRTNGTTFSADVLLTKMPLKNREVLQATVRDITELKLMQSALQESEEKFRSITNSVKDAIILIDNEAKIIYWNLGAEKMLGYSRVEAIGKEVHELLVPKTMCKDGRDCIKTGILQFAKTGDGAFTNGNVELTSQRKDGTEFPANISLTPIKLQGNWRAVGVVKDITEKKQIEQNLREAEKRYHDLLVKFQQNKT